MYPESSDMTGFLPFSALFPLIIRPGVDAFRRIALVVAKPASLPASYSAGLQTNLNALIKEA
jgi:hypothetical protein